MRLLRGMFSGVDHVAWQIKSRTPLRKRNKKSSTEFPKKTWKITYNSALSEAAEASGRRRRPVWSWGDANDGACAVPLCAGSNRREFKPFLVEDGWFYTRKMSYIWCFCVWLDRGVLQCHENRHLPKKNPTFKAINSSQIGVSYIIMTVLINGGLFFKLIPVKNWI